MRLKKSCFISLILAVMLSLSMATPVMAVPQMPHAFYGTVTVGDEPAPEGVLISAKIGGAEYATTTTSGGKYGYSPTFKVPGDDSDTPEVEGGVEGDTIKFYIEGVEVAIYIFSNGEVTGLPLEIDELPAPPPTDDDDVGVGVGVAPTYVETNLFGVEADFRISDQGKMLVTITAASADGMLTMTIPKGTIALDKKGNPLSTLTVAVDPRPPDPPDDAHIIGLAYDFEPDGATFDPPIILEWSYDPDEIPEGVAEASLMLAYYDGAEWVDLDRVVDTDNNIITASVSHFTTFAIFAVKEVVVEEEEEEEEVEEEEVIILTPPAISVLNLSIQPAEVEPGEAVIITVSVANTGGTEGSYTVVLKLNGVKEAEKSVTIAAGSRLDFSFVVSREAGSYTITVDGLSGSFTVVTVVPVVTPPAPTNWALIIGAIVAGVVVAAILVYFLVIRRRAA